MASASAAVSVGHAAPALVHRAARAAAGKDDDHVRAQALELPLHQPVGALADRDHRRDGGDADDHAEHRQGRPHLVLAQGPHGDAERHKQVHAGSEARGQGLGLGDCGSGCVIEPSTRTSSSTTPRTLTGTTSCPSLSPSPARPSSRANRVLSLRPVVTSTALSRSSSTTQTCRRLRFLPASAFSDAERRSAAVFLSSSVSLSVAVPSSSFGPRAGRARAGDRTAAPRWES